MARGTRLTPIDSVPRIGTWIAGWTGLRCGTAFSAERQRDLDVEGAIRILDVKPGCVTMTDNPDLRSTSPHRAVVVGDDSAPMRVSPAQEWVEVRLGDGTERPDELPSSSGSMYVNRTFCFADLCGFTGYTRQNGPPQAVRLLGEFRTVTRWVATARGVRVAKWLGDGVMLVGVEPSPTIALGAHLIDHFSHTSVEVRVGIATGLALLFEGDDYIGEPVNLAAKLCAAAKPREILADTKPEDLPEWVVESQQIEVDIRGLGRIGGIHRLQPLLGTEARSTGDNEAE